MRLIMISCVPLLTIGLLIMWIIHTEWPETGTPRTVDMARVLAKNWEISSTKEAGLLVNPTSEDEVLKEKHLKIEIDDLRILKIFKTCINQSIHLVITMQSDWIWNQLPLDFLCKSDVTHLTLLGNSKSYVGLRRLARNFDQLESLRLQGDGNKESCDFETTESNLEQDQNEEVHLSKLVDIQLSNLDGCSNIFSVLQSEFSLPNLKSILVSNMRISDFQANKFKIILSTTGNLQKLVFTALESSSIDLFKNINLLSSLTSLVIRLKSPSYFLVTQDFWKDLGRKFPNLEKFETNLQISATNMAKLPLDSLRFLDIFVLKNTLSVNVNFLGKRRLQAQAIRLVFACNKAVKIGELSIDGNYLLEMSNSNLNIISRSQCFLRVRPSWLKRCKNYSYNRDDKGVAISFEGCYCGLHGC